MQTKRHTSTLLTDENRGVLRNVSILYVNTSRFFDGIRAAIGNKTGNILIHEKPFFMSKKAAIKKVFKFLQDLQPEKRLNPEKVIAKTKTYGNASNINVLKTEENFKGFAILTIVDGSNSSCTEEVFKMYKTL